MNLTAFRAIQTMLLLLLLLHTIQCFLEDAMHYDKIANDDFQTIDFDDKASRIGCFFACLGQKKGLVRIICNR